MELIKAEDYFKKAVAYLEGSLDGQPHERDVDKAEGILNEILNFNVGNETILYSLGSLYASKNYNGLAIQLLSQVTSRNPTFGEAWNNLGLAYKSLSTFDKAEFCLNRAAKFCKGPDRADIYCNLAAINVNRGRAKEIFQYLDKALEIAPDHAKAKWHMALAQLELRQWETAWDFHEYRLHGGAPDEIGVRNYHGPDSMTPWWDGKSTGTIVIHGEQGMGDEVMFSSCIPDALKVPGCDFIFEPSPRMGAIFQRAFPGLRVHATNEMHGESWPKEWAKPDYKIGLGSLPKFFRRSAQSFPGTPYLIPDKGARAWWGDKLKALGRRPNIGIAWQGGVAQTRYDIRSFHPTTFGPLFGSIDANWISLQYDNTAQRCVNEVKEQFGVKLHHWPKAVSQKNPDTGKMNDLDDLVALISKLDLVISVCQTSIHVAGALGVPCLCLVPSEPSWRYGNVDDTDMPWYRSVKLLRQAPLSNDWAPVIERAVHETRQLLKITEAAQNVNG